MHINMMYNVVCHDVILDCQNLLSFSVTSVGHTILSRWLGGDLGFHVCHLGHY